MATIHELQIQNRSYRRFRQEPVPREIIDYALENARIANSAVNEQLLRYTAVLSRENVGRLQPYVHWAAALPPEIGTPHPNERPTAFIVVTKAHDNTFLDIDLGIAAHSITISLIEHGYGSCILRNINAQAIQTLLDIPAAETIGMVIAIGKPACTSTIVPVEKSSLKYYVDDQRNYYVPKLAFNKIVRYR